ncbi:MAG TPA: S8 family serine peptidase [Flavobacteriales bacterium]|nr:S8 family serine peptidase [Flavobacteriales bacterium]
MDPKEGRVDSKWLTAVLFLSLGAAANAQTSPDTYWVAFTDKASTPYTLSQPAAFFSDRAIARRAAQGIAYDELDLPVDPAYVAQVDAIAGVEVLNRSKWFNGVTVRVQEEEAISAVQSLPCVLEVRSSGMRSAGPARLDKFGDRPQHDRELDIPLYGPGYRQLEMLNGQALHDIGHLGQGMLIGVLDSGFDGVDSSLAFEAVRERGGILGAWDLVDHDADVYDDHWHGRSVLSCMAARLDSQLIGTAPEADYVLIRTETVQSEYPVEEDNWVSGVELADSLGCDVLNTSLGYTTFDDSTMDHIYAMLDGQTLRCSIAANIASRKGMVPVLSAGNNGQAAWYHIGAPADAVDVLTVGGVNADALYAPFSSHGPSADGRVKPDVCAMGQGTTVLNLGVDSAVQANGTSFAAPVLAGLVACLWGAHPTRNAQDIMTAVRQSATLYNDPSDSLGFGVPDFGAASAWLQLTSVEQVDVGRSTLIHPSPFIDRMVIRDPGLQIGAAYVALFGMDGRALVFVRASVDGSNEMVLADHRLQLLPAGPYVLVVEQEGRLIRERVIKAP